MSQTFTDLLTEKGTLLADGATGPNLFNMGLMSADAPEMWNTQAPEKITALYKGAVDAGSDLFLTNSFGANASRLKLHGAAKRAHELSRVAAELGRSAGAQLLPGLCDDPLLRLCRHRADHGGGGRVLHGPSLGAAYCHRFSEEADWSGAVEMDLRTFFSCFYFDDCAFKSCVTGASIDDEWDLASEFFIHSSS